MPGQKQIDQWKEEGKSQEEIDALVAAAKDKNAGGKDDGAGNLDDLDPKEAAKLIKDLRAEAAKHRTKAKTLEEAEEARRLEAEAKQREEAEKRGEFENLYKTEKERADDLEKRVSAIDKQIEDDLAKEVAAIPEDKLALIPEALGNEAKLRHIRNLQAAGVFEKAKGPGVRPSGEKGATVTSRADFESDAERAAYIKQNGMKKYLALPAKPPAT